MVDHMTELRKNFVADPSSGLTANVTQLTDKLLNLDQLNALITASILHARINDTTVKGLRGDASTESQMTIDYAHHEIHDGTNFIVESWADVTGAAATYDLGITTPDTTKWAHLLMNFMAEAGFTITVYEGATFTGGTPVTAFNSNRNSATAATVAFVLAPTVTVLGTQITSWKIGSGTATGGVGGTRAERILKQNTKYLVRFTKLAAGTDYINYLFDWYEHANRN